MSNTRFWNSLTKKESSNRLLWECYERWRGKSALYSEAVYRTIFADELEKFFEEHCESNRFFLDASGDTLIVLAKNTSSKPGVKRLSDHDSGLALVLSRLRETPLAINN